VSVRLYWVYSRFAHWRARGSVGEEPINGGTAVLQIQAHCGLGCYRVPELAWLHNSASDTMRVYG